MLFSPVCFYVSQLLFPGPLSISQGNANLFRGKTGRNSQPGGPFPYLNPSRDNNIAVYETPFLTKAWQEKKKDVE
jgi:hypothetical protein